MANTKTILKGCSYVPEFYDSELSVEFKEKQPDSLWDIPERIEVLIKNTDPNYLFEDYTMYLDLSTAIKLSKVLRYEISKLKEEVERG